MEFFFFVDSLKFSQVLVYSLVNKQRLPKNYRKNVSRNSVFVYKNLNAK